MKIRQTNRKKRLIIQKVILIGVFLVIISSVGLLFYFYNLPKAIFSREVEKMARNYYEEYYYPTIANSGNRQQLTQVLFSQSEEGTEPVQLKTLILKDLDKNLYFYNLVTSKGHHCDESLSDVVFYPTKPFDKKDYELDIKLVCYPVK